MYEFQPAIWVWEFWQYLKNGKMLLKLEDKWKLYIVYLLRKEKEKLSLMLWLRSLSLRYGNTFQVPQSLPLLYNKQERKALVF